jgi:hypothetical protein
MRRITMSAALAVATTVIAPDAARAADEEIQVYMDEIGVPLHPGLDVHLNYVAKGRSLADYPGEQASEGRTRITPEWSLALNRDTELGLYLPLMTVDRSGRLEAGGVKGRIKWIAPRPEGQDWFWGANFELGRVRHSLDINPWNAELKGIAGLRKGPWTLAANLNIDWVVSGPEHGPVEAQIATKAAYKVGESTAIGVESYNSLGGGHSFGRLGQQDQQTYLVVDRTFGNWDLNFGVGYAYGRPEDRQIFKVVIGVPIS